MNDRVTDGVYGQVLDMLKDADSPYFYSVGHMSFLLLKLLLWQDLHILLSTAVEKFIVCNRLNSNNDNI